MRGSQGAAAPCLVLHLGLPLSSSYFLPFLLPSSPPAFCCSMLRNNLCHLLSSLRLVFFLFTALPPCLFIISSYLSFAFLFHSVDLAVLPHFYYFRIFSSLISFYFLFPSVPTPFLLVCPVFCSIHLSFLMSTPPFLNSNYPSLLLSVLFLYSRYRLSLLPSFLPSLTPSLHQPLLPYLLRVFALSLFLLVSQFSFFLVII